MKIDFHMGIVLKDFDIVALLNAVTPWIIFILDKIIGA